MQRAKLFSIAVFTLLAFLCFITVFLPSKVTISKSVLVNANAMAVAMQINDFKNWKNWYPAFQNKDISADISQRGDTSFAILTNEDGKKISLTLLKSSAENINILLSGENGRGKNYQFILIPNGEAKTQITWNVNVDFGWYPWNKFAGIFLDKVSGPRYEAALQNLKVAAEKDLH